MRKKRKMKRRRNRHRASSQSRTTRTDTLMMTTWSWWIINRNQIPSRNLPRRNQNHPVLFPRKRHHLKPLAGKETNQQLPPTRRSLRGRGEAGGRLANAWFWMKMTSLAMRTIPMTMLGTIQTNDDARLIHVHYKRDFLEYR